jgi:hypothetical protein
MVDSSRCRWIDADVLTDEKQVEKPPWSQMIDG